jgi:hypothetical protein
VVESIEASRRLKADAEESAGEGVSDWYPLGRWVVGETSSV